MQSGNAPTLAHPEIKKIAVAGLALCIAIIGGAVAATVSYSSRDWLLTTISLVLIAPILVRFFQAKFDVFEPLTVMNLVLLAMFVGRPLSLISHSDFVHIGYDFSAGFDRALFVAFVGCVSFVVGYAIPIGRDLGSRAGPIAGHWKADAVVKFAISILLLGLLLYGAFVIQSGGLPALRSLLSGRSLENEALFRSSSGYLYHGVSLAVPAALLLLGAAVSRRSKLLFLISGLAAVPHVIVYSASGGRLNIMLLLLPITAFLFLIYRKRPGLFTTLFALYLTVALGIGFLGDQRQADVRTESRVTILQDSLVHPERGIDRLLIGGDTAMFDTLAIMQQTVPESLSYQHGSVVRDLAVRMIPRNIFPDKGLEANDRFIVELWAKQYSIFRASSASSFLGQLYLDSGFAAVALGMFAVGIVLRAAWAWRSRWPTNIAVQLTYAALLPYVVVLARGTLTGVVSRIIFTALPVLVGFWLARRANVLHASPQHAELFPPGRQIQGSHLASGTAEAEARLP